MKKIIISSSLLLSSIIIAQVGINTNNPTETLDVNGNARVRSMKEINTGALTLEYNRQIVANENGTLGYVLNSSSVVPWTFVDNKYATLSAPISSNIEIGYVYLGFQIPVTIPPNTQAQVVINYNMPVLHSNPQANTIGYIGCTLFKSINGGSITELEMGSRKYTVPGAYNGGIYGAAALGNLISGFAIDIISNNGNAPMNIVYELDGYIEGNNSATSRVTFGMYAAASAPNYNWGRGAMSAQIFTKPIN